MMRQTLVPVLMLVAVALSSSKVLPLLSSSQLRLQLLGTEGQQNDNTYSFKGKHNNVLNNNIFYNLPIDDTQDYMQRESDHSQISYSNTDNNRAKYNFNIINKIGNRNGEGFRKEQWHNYPRQLDRLQKYLNEQQNYDKSNLDPGEIITNDKDTIDEQYRTLDDKTNDLEIDNKLTPEFTYALTKINTDADPLLNLKLRLAGLSNSFVNVNDILKPTTHDRGSGKTELEEKDEQLYTDHLDPMVNVINDIRLAEPFQYNDITDDAEENKTVSKRFFSLWSRVQGMSHKGHEILQRRRHMHTFYGMPEGDGSRVLTAETRAILMRPPGSPLRWG